MRNRLILAITTAITFLAVDATSQSITMPANIDEIPKGYVCYWTNVAVKIDGKLNEASWEAVPWTDNFVDIQGDSQPVPRFKTKVKMMWDSAYFYIGAELEEPNVWATLRKRDTVIFCDNDFEVFMDPNGDNFEYYEMEMNAFNTVWDLFLPKPYKDGGKAVDAWNIKGLRTAVHVDGTINNPRDADKGWTVELAMPWAALKQYAHRPAPPTEGERWRVNFSRVEWQTEIVNGRYRKIKGMAEDNWVWSPQGLIDMHRPEMWGYVQFTELGAGRAPYHRDPVWDVRRVLMRIYYAERDYHEKNKKWTATLSDLNPGDISSSDLSGAPEIVLTSDGYIATVSYRLPRGTFMKWHVTESSRISAEQ